MMHDSPIRILLVDDHPVVRDGLHGQLESQADLIVVGEAASTEEALAVVNHIDIDIVITDLRMPGRGGIELIRELSASYQQVCVLVLTTFGSDTEIAEAIAAGAKGYLLKDANRETIYDALRTIARGKITFPPFAMQPIADVPTTTFAAGALSAREIEVLRLVASGNTNRQIGNSLYIGESTVKTHLQHVFRKLDAADRAAAVAAGYARGLL